MSGIVAIVNKDGAPVDHRLLRRMTEHMAFRGPDAQELLAEGHVGLGHAMLRTTAEAEGERQPLNLEGRVWVTADARVDGRPDLIRKLRGEGREGLGPSATDAELVMHAYLAWGETCVEHLIGDFAFAVWDAPRRRLFCARDHFGVKPLYYSSTPGSLVVSNTLNCVRLHPEVSDDLNDLGIADFLIYGSNQEAGTTAFADVLRLPPAHTLTWEDGRLSLNRYWTPPADGRIRYRRAGDYVEHFEEVFRLTVGDRLRATKIGVLMSGGLDSPAVAATAKKVLSQDPASRELRAYTSVYDELIPDKERYYSGLVADRLGIPIEYIVADRYSLYERWDFPELRTPEPNDDVFAGALFHDKLRLAAANCRVVLSGYGGDSACLASPTYVSAQLRGLRLKTLASEALEFVFLARGVPPLGFRTFFKRCIGKKPRRWKPQYPRWVSGELETRLGLKSRWEDLTAERPMNGHPLRPEAYQEFASPLWANIFEPLDPGVSRLPLEIRHPFLDTRLASFLLSLPPIPWFLNKELLRTSMRGTLPEEVRVRPKAPLAVNPIHECLRRAGKHLYDGFEPAPGLERYVNPGLLPDYSDQIDPDQVWSVTRPCSLNYWLRWLEESGIT